MWVLDVPADGRCFWHALEASDAPSRWIPWERHLNGVAKDPERAASETGAAKYLADLIGLDKQIEWEDLCVITDLLQIRVRVYLAAGVQADLPSSYARTLHVPQDDDISAAKQTYSLVFTYMDDASGHKHGHWQPTLRDDNVVGEGHDDQLRVRRGRR
mmetsp:Transcript_1994/g.5861  ORF Transcript_1994/g.5861 Transcript_1994/m.5861 type:complete len:158 (-) Transcript_1994:329-802(-)